MKVFLTGATGFVGQEILRHVLDAGHQVRTLVRFPSKFDEHPKLETVVGDVTESESLQGKLADCDAVIHLVGIIREFPARNITFQKLHTEATRNMLRAAKEQKVPRFLQMSANGTRADALTGYHKTKWEAEQWVRQSELDWTIFRPSLIFGPRDQFVNMLADLIRKLPVVPVMGDGKYRLQPVSIKDVAAGFVNALTTSESIGRTFYCGGPQAYSYDEILDMIGAAIGKSAVYKLHLPLLLMKPLIRLLQSIPQFPMTRDQLQMLREENICDPSEWRQTLHLEIKDFASGIAEYLIHRRKNRLITI
jgi:nucleoside-diphosphate-sugar epimerase